MKTFGDLVRHLRIRAGLSQRELSKATRVSFRQIQRIESGESDPSLRLANQILKAFDAQLIHNFREPDWALLCSIGMPLELSAPSAPPTRDWDFIQKEIAYACHFLIENKNDNTRGRFFDSLKALLLSLKSHYPTRFKFLERKVDGQFDLTTIRGRDIKLRNICLHTLAKRLPPLPKA